MSEKRTSKRPPQASTSTLRGQPTTTLRGMTADATDTAPSTQLNQLLKDMRKLKRLDHLMELVLIAVAPYAPKTALFAVRKDAFVGTACTLAFGDRRLLAKVSIPTKVPSVLAIAAVGGEYIGPLVRSAAHAPLLQFIKSKEPELFVTSIRAGGKAAMILISHEIGETVKVEPTIGEVVRVASETLEGIVRARGRAEQA